MTRNSCFYSIAPMMRYTDRYFRFFLRQLCPNTILYTEMQVASSIVFGEERRFLDFDPRERPLILQLASADPAQLAKAVQCAEHYAYDGYNLNIGCPSEKAGSGGFGVCQMAEVDAVLRLCDAVRSASSKPLSIKHRIGIGNDTKYEDLHAFVHRLYEHGIRHFIVHARVALLGGYKPHHNRSIPPLRYADVYRLKKDFPKACIEINGGIRSIAEITEHLKHTDAVMIGRLAYQDPFILHRIDRLMSIDSMFTTKDKTVSALQHNLQTLSSEPYSDEEKTLFLQIIHEGLARAQQLKTNGDQPWRIIRHLLYFFAGSHGARTWRRIVAGKDISSIAKHAQECITFL